MMFTPPKLGLKNIVQADFSLNNMTLEFRQPVQLQIFDMLPALKAHVKNLKLHGLPKFQSLEQ